MKILFGLLALLASSSTFAVEGYKDIYLNREKTVYIHGITCSANIKNLRTFKGAIVYTNTKSIEKGTYYFDSPYGKYSYTFNTTKNPAILNRGKLKEGQTSKAAMEKDICIIAKINNLPAPLLKSIKVVTLQPNDPNWSKSMQRYAFVAGKPAYAKGVYEDTRASKENALAAKEVFAANQAYLKKTEAIFTKKFNQIANELPQKVTSAIKYAYQNTGSFKDKTYPNIEKPAVWTNIAKERYNDLVRRRNQGMEWDVIIEKNFDWLFALVGKDNTLESTKLINPVKLKWHGTTIEQLATVQATFSDGKKLDLDFLIKSSKVNNDVFATLVDIEKAMLLARTNAIVAYRKEIKPIKLPLEKSLSVYSPTRKTITFFSNFRTKKIGDTYRLK